MSNEIELFSSCGDLLETRDIYQIKECVFQQLSRYNILEIIEIIKRSKLKILELVYICDNIETLKGLEYQYDLIQDISNNISIHNILKLDGKTELHYPPLDNPHFTSIIEDNPLFRQYESLSIIPQLTQLIEPHDEKNQGVLSNDFIKSQSQEFVSHFISPNTPYKSLLLFHGVGVGKTCAALSIANNFIPYYKQKVLIVTPNTKLWNSWKDEIFNVNKEKKK